MAFKMTLNLQCNCVDYSGHDRLDGFSSGRSIFQSLIDVNRSDACDARIGAKVPALL
jgi:hypothetical protein